MNNTLVVLNDNNEPVTTSLKVAERFEKRHDHTIRRIENIIETLGNQGIEAAPNFGVGFYMDGNGQKRKMYEMNRKGFMLLVMGLTGEKAMKFKNDFVDAFDAMEAELTKKVIDPTKLSRKQILLIALEAEEKVEQLEHKVTEDAPKVQVYDNYMSSDGLKSFSDVGRDLGIGAKTFCQMLVDDKILFRQGKRLKAYLQYIQAGYFKTVTDVKDDYVYTQHKVTPEGFVWLEGKYGKEAIVLT